MPISTQLNIAPYYNDFDENKDFYQILFQPGVSVQVRELNQLQTILQKQIERFGDNIFAKGTIVSGCNFQFINPLPYVKLTDVDYLGSTTVPVNYLGYNVENETTGLKAHVVNYADGFEASAPNLKTIYVSYQNYGSNGSTRSFTAGDTLKVYDPVINGVESIEVLNGGLAFSNADTVVAVSAVVLSVASGSLSVGDYLMNDQNANVEIVSIDSTTLANNSLSIVTVKPRSSDLANSEANSAFWTLQIGQSVTNPAASLSASVTNIIGGGLKAAIVTNGSGAIQQLPILARGVGYTTPPYVTIRSIDNTTGYTNLNLNPRNYLTKLVVSSAAGAVGNGYAFGVSEGVIFQKGFFLRVVPQTVIVSKYDQLPDNVAVGFVTNEQIVDSNMDISLRDNVNNQLNEQAPGANRLKLVPSLKLSNLNAATSNSQFLNIVEWKEGRPYKQDQSTIYSIIGDEMARRTEESGGDFVTDPFLVTTRSTTNTSLEGQYFNVVIDPGTAYIKGHRVSTQGNYNTNVLKGTNTAITNNHTVSLNYGNYVIANNMVGIFQYNTGDTVKLYDTAKNYLSNTSNIDAGNTTPVGNQIGTAYLRSLMLQDNAPGTAGATYRLYLFNIEMNTGKNFKDVKSVYYDGTYKGICDVVLEQDATTGANVAVIKDYSHNQLLFYSGVESLKNANSVTYQYRTIDQATTVANTGLLVKDISADPNEVYPYSGNLSSVELQDFYIVPANADLVAVTSATGNASVNTTTANVTGTGTLFVSEFDVGDYVTVSANSTGGGHIARITNIVNNTLLVLDSNCTFANTNCDLYRTFPKNVPVPFGYRSGLTGNVDVSGQVLTLDFGMAFSYSGDKITAVGCNIQRNNPTQLTKTANRNKFIKIYCGNNSANTVGPWSVGVPDVFRLRGVYIGNSTVSNTGSNYISNFYIDHNQNSNYYGLGYLYLKPDSSLTLTATDYILVQFDYFTTSGTGFVDTVSYLGSNATAIYENDALPLSSLTTQINSFEVPELFTDSGNEMDLLQYFDFRPKAANTVAPASTYGSAPLNPAETVTLSTSGEKKFPVPDSEFISDIEYFIGRRDSIFVDKNGRFSVVAGKASSNTQQQTLPTQPSYTMKLADIVVPPYPNLPISRSINTEQIIDTGIANQKYLTTRIKKKTVTGPSANNILPYNQPKVYTMYDIGNIERRLSNVEYYVALNSLETGLAQKVIPSSTDPTLDRFKFGIFVDDFVTNKWSETTNPQYAAQKEDADIVPMKMTWDIGMVGDIIPYMDYAVVDQSIATVGGITDPLSLGPICAINLANTVAYNQFYRNSTDVDYILPGVSDTVQLAFASNTAVYGTVQYLQNSIDQWLQNHRYDTIQDIQAVWDYLETVYLAAASETIISTRQRFNVQGTSQIATGEGWTSFGWTREEIAAMGLNPDNFSPFTLFNFTENIIQKTIPGVLQIFNEYPGINLLKNVEINTGTKQQVIDALLKFANDINKTVVVPDAPTGGQFVQEIYYPPVTLYFYNYDQGVKIEIYQNDTMIANSASATALTTSEQQLLTGQNGQFWFNDYPEYFLQNPVDSGSGYMKYAGKITFNYNPANGSNFTIKTTASTYSYRWRWVMAYPIEGKSVGCVPPAPNLPVNLLYEPIYHTYGYAVSNAASITYSSISNARPVIIDTPPSDPPINILVGYTAIWNSVNPGEPTTSIVPFDITKNWLNN